MTQWVEFDSEHDVALATADTIKKHAHHAIEQRGEFKLVLAGGTTPLNSYRLLAQQSLDWDAWKIFYGDERCLDTDDAERNHQMVMKTGLTGHVTQHYVIPAELGPEKGAQSYQSTITDQLPFDLVLLGMGEDGHTASLFPGHDWSSQPEDKLVIGVQGSPKPPSDRVSLSLYALQKCRHMLVLASGESKRKAMQQWQQDVHLPIAQVADCEQAVVFVETSLLR